MPTSRATSRLLGLAAALASACAAGVAAAESITAPPMPIGASANAPLGFLDFCRRSPADCASAGETVTQVGARASSLYWAGVFGAEAGPASTAPDWRRVFPPRTLLTATDWLPSSAEPAKDSVPPAIAMTRKDWRTLSRLNRRVNRAIRQGSDARIYGQGDFWVAPSGSGARGDCEDYVLAKRRALLEAGYPAAALSIALVETRWGESHAVLLVATDAGEFVLDNLTARISPWNRAGYSWRERQAPGSIFNWVRADG